MALVCILYLLYDLNCSLSFFSTSPNFEFVVSSFLFINGFVEASAIANMSNPLSLFFASSEFTHMYTFSTGSAQLPFFPTF